MNKFKEEFSQLLRRYASAEPTNNNNGQDAVAQLTNQQIVDAIHETLRATLNINPQNFVESSALKTPVNEIVVTTPDAPDVLRVDYNQNSLLQNRYKTSDTATGENKEFNIDSFKQSILLDTPNENGTPSSDKFDLGLNKNLESLDQKFKDISKSDTTKMYSIVEDAHKDAMKVVSKLEGLRQLLMPEARPIRRLSAIMSLPKGHQPQQNSSSALMNSLRSTQRAKALTRRSMPHLTEDVPVTPTSSRPSLVIPPSQAKKPVGLTPKPGNKLQPQNRPATTDTNKSTLASGLTKSPSKSLPAKNAKYAHVQSTIPKPSKSSR